MEIACQNPECQNHGKEATGARSSLYYKHGSQKSGCQTYKCRECNEMFHVEHFVFVDGNKDPKEALHIIRLLLSRDQLSDISSKVNVGVDRIKSYILYVSDILSRYEEHELSETKVNLTLRKEPCQGLAITAEYDKDAFYIKSLKFSFVEHKKVKESPSISTLEIERGITQKLAIFDQKFRGQRIGLQNDILNIYRICFNFSDTFHKDKTPAMRVGLAEQPLSLQQLMSISI